MSMRYPRLAMLRARRQRWENELAAPHRAAAGRALQVAREERAAREGLERIMRSSVAPAIMDHMARDMGRGFYGEIMKAMRGISALSGTTTITVPTGMLMGADRESIVFRVVDWWRSENVPRMSFRAIRGEMEHRDAVTVIEVQVPELRYRHRVADLSF
ncbi:MAG: hypothetical protein AB7F78_00125 [Hyphomicrobiaceae bacterium]